MAGQLQIPYKVVEIGAAVEALDGMAAVETLNMVLAEAAQAICPNLFLMVVVQTALNRAMAKR